MSSQNHRKNIVVVGGSYAGSKAAELIAEKMHATHRTILVEKNTHFQHLFAFPRFAVVPTHEHKAFIPFFDAHRTLPAETKAVVNARVTEVHPDCVVLDHGDSPLPYEYLVMATGTKLSPPGTMLATAKSDSIAYFQKHQSSVKAADRIIVVGGGAVGIQLATDIKDYHPNKSVTLVHSRGRLMHKFHPRMHEVLSERAKELGIEVILDDRVQLPEDGFSNDGTPFDIVLKSGRVLPADLAIMATGQTPLSDPIRTLSPASIAPSGFISVKRTLQLADDRFPRVFAIGDVADTQGQKTARVGLAHADIVANNIEALARGATPEAEDNDSKAFKIHMSLGMVRRVRFRS
ncbi:apoptosis-inducing factor [Amylostereum chailletii]|nr:apoptosis-inducing factor [Amylostereum chailletii]